MSIEDYNLIKVLGRGAFGKVKKIKRKFICNIFIF